MSDKKNSTLVLGGALIVGLVLGAAIGSRGGDAQKAAARQIAALEAQTAEKLAGVEARLAELAAGGDTAAAVAALDARVAALDAAVAGAPAAVAAVQDRVAVLADQMVLMIDRMANVSAAPAPAPAEAQAAAAAPEAAAAPAADDAAARLAAEVADGGAALAVGQAATLGETTVFLSRIDANGAARLHVRGLKAAAMVGADNGDLQLADGCALTLLGVADGKAYLKRVCVQ